MTDLDEREPAAGVEIGTWDPVPPPAPGRVVLVAPHPDDEVLGAGMTMVWWQEHGSSLVVVAVTDGDASHARSTAITPAELRVRRREERSAAFAALGLRPVVHPVGLPDGGVRDNVDRLTDVLTRLTGVDDVALVAPWSGDDHPDHRAVHAAAALAASRTGTALWRVPIWGRIRRDRPYDADGAVTTLHLTDAARRRKALAVTSFVSQLEPLGSGPHDGPVVHPAELAAMLDGTEVLIR